MPIIGESVPAMSSARHESVNGTACQAISSRWRRAQDRRLLHRNDIGSLAVQFLEQHPDLAFGEIGAKAVRVTSNGHGLPNFRSSRSAELYHLDTRESV